MAVPTISQTVTGSGTSVSSYSLTSWTPSANDLIIIWVATRQTVAVSSISGNGITFTNVFAHQDQQSQCRLECWRGQSASPSSGQITVTMASSAVATIAAAHRIAGANTGGTNGSDAVQVNAVADTGGSDTDTPSVDITTLSIDNLVIGGATHRTRTYTVGTGETSISINNSVGSAGDTTSISTEYQNVASASTVTINGTLDSATDWVQGAVAIRPGGNSYSLTMARTSASTTPDTAAAAVARALTVNLTSAGVTTDTPVLSVARPMVVNLASQSSTPNTASLGIPIALLFSRASTSSTPDTPTLISLVAFVMARTSASTTPDTAAVVVARALLLNLTSQSSTPNIAFEPILSPFARHSFAPAAEDLSSQVKRAYPFAVAAEDLSSQAKRTFPFVVAAGDLTSEA